MITSRTKKQLLIFVIVTLLGASFVGARYAQLDRLFVDTTYSVNARFTDSGGIFKGAEVTYRGVKVGQVSALELTRNGVDVVMGIDKSQDTIPARALAVVGNKSAVGEQYIELQPKDDTAPYLKDGSTIRFGDTRIPIGTTELLTNVDGLVNSVPQGDLRTVVGELGAAFQGTGPTLGQLIDTSNSFIKEADRNFDVTSALIEDSNTVLQTQSDKSSAIRSFAKNLSLFSGTLAGSDADLRKVIDNGSATTNQLRIFLEENQVDLGQLINNLLTTGRVVVKHLDGIRQLLVLYPYVVEGGFSVLGKGPDGKYDANFGLVMAPNPGVCHNGYPINTDTRPPQDLSDRPMNVGTKCADPPGKSNPRGAQNSPGNRTGTAYRAPVVATYDHTTGKVVWTDQAPGADVTYSGGAQKMFGRDSWKQLLLGPVAAEE